MTVIEQLPNWSLRVIHARDPSSTLICELPEATLNDVTWELNKEETINYQLAADDPRAALITSVNTDTQLYKGTTCVGWGTNWKRKKSRTSSSGGGGSPTGAGIISQGLMALFKHRLVLHATLTYTSIDQTAIFAQLVSAAQTGLTDMDLHIVTSAIASAHIRSRTYPRTNHQTIYDILQSFSTLTLNDGFDFAVDIHDGINRIFTTYYPFKGTFYPNAVFEWDKNITGYEWNEDGTNLANEIFATGGSSGGVKFENNYVDTGSSSIYGRMQGVVSDPSQNDVAWLLNIAQANVNIRNAPTVDIKVTAIEVPDTGIVGVLFPGDSVQVLINDNDVQVNSIKRIQTMKWTPASNTVVLTFVPPIVTIV